MTKQCKKNLRPEAADHPRRSLSEKHAANYLGISRSLLSHGRACGVLPSGISTPPFRRIGRRILYDIKDLDAWLDSFPTQHTLAEANARTGSSKDEVPSHG